MDIVEWCFISLALILMFLSMLANGVSWVGAFILTIGVYLFLVMVFYVLSEPFDDYPKE